MMYTIVFCLAFYIIQISTAVIFDGPKDELRIERFIASLEPPENGECFHRQTTLNFTFSGRFSWETLELNCQKWRAFNEEANITSPRAVVDPFTKLQRTYLNSLITPSNSTLRLKYPLVIRKELRSMNSKEKKKFWTAVNQLKNKKIDGISAYELIAWLRHPYFAPGAQMGAAFLPWHREYLREFEVALQQIDPDVSLPFWDVTIEGSMPTDVSDSILWTEHFLGTSRGPIISGPVAHWEYPTIVSIEKTNSTKWPSKIIGGVLQPIARNLSDYQRNTTRLNLPQRPPMTTHDVEYILSRESFDQFSSCASNGKIEEISRRVHDWIGGTQTDHTRATRDPVYFLVHAYFDYLWELWRQKQSFTNRTQAYPRGLSACSQFHQPTSTMRPFHPLTNLDGLSDIYTQVFYAYQSAPRCLNPNDQCLSTYLYCDLDMHSCLPKVINGSYCQFNNLSCFDSTCINDICTN